MRKKDIVFIAVALLFIVFLVGALVHIIQRNRESLQQREKTIQENENVTPGLTTGIPKKPTGVEEEVGVTPAPTPTSLLSIGITPIVPKEKPEAGGVEGGETNEGQEQEDTVQMPMPVWTEEGVADIGDLYALTSFVGNVYTEQSGVRAVGMPVGAEEYEQFKNPCAYFVDRYGFLYVNMKVVLDDGTTKYLTCALGYYGSDLAVYDIEEVK